MLPAFSAILNPPAFAQRAQAQSGALDSIPVITRRERRLIIRPAVPSDSALIVQLLECLSEQSARLRFFRPLNNHEIIEREATRIAGNHMHAQIALVAIAFEAGHERAVAVAELVQERADPQIAEFAIVVRDDYQHEGLGRMLSQLIVELSQRRGIRTLRAAMLAENRAVLQLVRSLDVPYTTRAHWGEITALLTLGSYAHPM